MAAHTYQGVAAWGVQGGVNGVTGIVTSIGQEDEAVLAPEYNEAGQVVKQTMYDRKTTLTCTIEVAAGTALPKVGEAITINGKQGYITRASLAEENQAYRKISVTAEVYLNCNKTTAL